MRSLIIFTFILTVGTVVFGSIELEPNTHDRNRRQLNLIQSPSSHSNLDGFTRQGVPVVRNSYGDERHVTASFDGRNNELDKYRDFVNGPWVRTENLGQILTARARPELRTGRGIVDDDIWTRMRRQAQPYSPPPTVATWGRVPDPWYRRADYTRGRTQARDPVTITPATYRRRQYQPHYSAYPSSAQKLYATEWEVASRGEDHVTYRLKHGDTWLPADYSGGTTDPVLLRQMGHGHEKVTARVADLRSGSGREDPHGYQNYYGKRQHSRWHQRPETRSMNTNGNAGLVRQGNWVKTLDTGTHVTWEKVGSTNPTLNPALKSAESVLPVMAHPRTYDQTHAPPLSTRTYHRDHYIPRTARESWTARPIRRPRSWPNYPILNDRETAEKARLSGPNVMIQQR